MRSSLQRVLKILLATIPALLCFVLLLSYLRYTAYEAEPCSPFAGEKWYNPYPDLTDTLLRANFHAHSRSWAGVTWGENTAEEMIGAYAAKGYDVPGLSNYHKITPEDLYPEPLIYIPTYEHGFNLGKVHCLCIGAKELSFIEYPWHLSLSHTRNVMHSLRQHCDLVALAHPGARNAYTPAEMPWLDAMQMIELEYTKGMRATYWDGALSCGRAVWVLSDDDVHALSDEKIFRHWNMIYVKSSQSSDAVEALKYGHHFGVLSYDGMSEDNRLTMFEISGDTLHVALRDTFNRLDFIGQKGTSVHAVSGASKGWYVLKDHDTYVRIEVHHDHSVMYLNPVFRYDGDSLPFEKSYIPAVQIFKTWTVRIVVLLLIVILIYTWQWLIKRR